MDQRKPAGVFLSCLLGSEQLAAVVLICEPFLSCLLGSERNVVAG